MKNFKNLLRSHQSLDPSPGLPPFAWTRSRVLLPPDGPGPAPGFSSSRVRVLTVLGGAGPGCGFLGETSSSVRGSGVRVAAFCMLA